MAPHPGGRRSLRFATTRSHLFIHPFLLCSLLAAGLLTVGAPRGAPSLTGYSPHAVGDQGCHRSMAQGGCDWTATTTLLLHGLSLDLPGLAMSSLNLPNKLWAGDCDAYWGGLRSDLDQVALQMGKAPPDFVPIGYESSDLNCVGLPGVEGDDDSTPLEVLGVQLREFIDVHYPGQYVNIVGHSEGALIARAALDPDIPSPWPLPQVNEVVSVGGPFDGTVFGCFELFKPVMYSIYEMCNDPTLNPALVKLEQAPAQGPGGTRWTLIGVDGFLGGDGVVTPSSALAEGAGDQLDPAVRIDYTNSEYYHSDEVYNDLRGDACDAGFPSEWGREAGADCYDVSYSVLGGPIRQELSGSWPAIPLSIMFGLAGSLPHEAAPHLDQVVPATNPFGAGSQIDLVGTGFAPWTDWVYLTDGNQTWASTLDQHTLMTLSSSSTDLRFLLPSGLAPGTTAKVWVSDPGMDFAPSNVLSLQIPAASSPTDPPPTWCFFGLFCF